MNISSSRLRAESAHPFEELKNSSVPKYMWRVLRDANITEPPVSEFDTGDYLQATIETYPLAQLEAGASARQTDVCLPDSMLNKAERIVYVDPRIPYSRNRFSIFHDYAHLILPWHGSIDFRHLEEACSTDLYGQREREADVGACELSMPIHWFVRDINKWKEVSWQAVSYLANGYRMSLETVAIRYVKFHPDPCALLVCDLDDSRDAHLRAKKVFKIRYAIVSFTFPLHVCQDFVIVEPYAMLSLSHSSCRLLSTLMPGVRYVSMPGSQLGLGSSKEFMVEARLIREPRVSMYILVWLQ